jgi:hypothetical protein
MLDAGAPLPSRPIVETGTLQQFCSGRGSAVQIVQSANGAAPGCVGRLERALFSYALCACGDLKSDGTALVIDSFDSRQGQYTPGENGAAVGVNGMWFASASRVQIGSAILAGGASIASDNFLVAGDLWEKNPLTATSSGIRIARDLWAAGDVTAPATRSVNVGRDAYLAPGRSGSDRLALGGSPQFRNFDVPAPCACDLNIPALVSQAQTANDNSAPGLSSIASSLGFATGIVPLPCGRLAFSGDTTLTSTVAFTVAQRTALFVEGNLSITGLASFDPGTTGELDIFVSGNLFVTGTVVIGNPKRPYATRLYVGGNAINVSGAAVAALELYAPHAAVQLPGATDVYGAVVGQNISTSGAARVHFDRAILDTSNGCSVAPPPVCDSCEQCTAGLACVAGSCGPCTRDADCCEPMVCASGTCQPLSLPTP